MSLCYMNKRYLYKGRIYKIFRKKVTLGNKVKFEKDYIEGKDRVIIVPETQNNKLILIKFPCLAFDNKSVKFSLRFPRGVIDKGENLKDAAKRELLEETGYETRKLLELSVAIHPNPAVIHEKWHVFIASDLIEVKNYKKDSFEDWGLVELTENKIESEIKKGKIIDASAAVAFYLYKLNKK